VHKIIQFSDLNQLVDIILKYALGSYFKTKIAHMGGEEIFGSYKWKSNLPLGLKGDSHRHDCVKVFCSCVNT
jgi:hypothetical protein